MRSSVGSETARRLWVFEWWSALEFLPSARYHDHGKSYSYAIPSQKIMEEKDKIPFGVLLPEHSKKPDNIWRLECDRTLVVHARCGKQLPFRKTGCQSHRNTARGFGGGIFIRGYKMDELLIKNPKLFHDYAIRDAVISLYHGLYCRMWFGLLECEPISHVRRPPGTRQP